MFRYKVMSEIVYKGRQLAAGRLIRATRDSAPYFAEHFGDKVQMWEDWPNPLTEPKQIKNVEFKIKNTKLTIKNDARLPDGKDLPCALEADAWESIE